MELVTYLQILNRRKLVIIITTIAAMVSFYYIQPQIQNTYETTAILRILPYSSTDPPYTQIVYAERIMNTYVKIASSTPVLEKLRERLGVTADKPASTEVDIIPDSELLQITVKDSDPILARDAANTLAEILLEERSIRDIRVFFVEPATIPENSSLVDITMLRILTVILGIVVGTGLAFIIENLDTRLHSSEQIHELTGLPILGEIPAKIKWKRVPLLADTGPYIDAFRRLRINILSLAIKKPFDSILVISAEPKEGKSTIVANLAVSLAQINHSVVVVDADLHYPTIHLIYDLPNDIGLSDILVDNELTPNMLQESPYVNVKLLASGPPVPNSTELLGSNRMIDLLKSLKNQFDFVIIDAPAYLGIADASVLASAVTGILLVARCDYLKEKDLKTMCDQLKKFEGNLIGVVVNRVKKSIKRKYHKYYQFPKRIKTIKKISPKFIVQESVVIQENQSFELSNDHQGNSAVSIPFETNDALQSIDPEKIQLTRIHGIGPEYEKALNAIGIWTYAQLAEQDPERLAEKLNTKLSSYRIRRDRWIEQARNLIQLESQEKSFSEGKNSHLQE
jgi:capsular exopolysaccharide synthesis family protein